MRPPTIPAGQHCPYNSSALSSCATGRNDPVAQLRSRRRVDIRRLSRPQNCSAQYTCPRGFSSYRPHVRMRVVSTWSAPSGFRARSVLCMPNTYMPRG